MAKKVIDKLMLNGQAYQTAYDNTLTIQKNWTTVDSVNLNATADKTINITVPTNSDYVDLTSAQSVGGVKTFTSEIVVPSKTTDATNTGTSVATEAQVYKKQDALSLPSTPTSGNLVAWGADNKTLVDGWAIPTGFDPANAWTAGQVLKKTSGWYEWANDEWTTYTAGTNISIDANNVISAVDTTYSEVSKSDMDTGTSTTAGVVSAKSIADYVSGRIGSAVEYKGQVADYASLPANPEVGDMYNVVAAHTTAPEFDAWTNVVWNGTAWDPMAEMVDLSNLVDLTSAQTISWAKTFSAEPILPSKTSAATNTWTAPASEAQVYAVAQSIPTVNDATISFTQAGNSIGTLTTNQGTAGTLAFAGVIPATQAEWDDLPSSKMTDNNTYLIYSTIND